MTNSTSFIPLTPATPATARTRWGNHPGRLTREQVLAKYGPVPDSLWTPEREAAFFARLSRASYLYRATQNEVRQMLVRAYGEDTLRAKRMGSSYLDTLGAILGVFAEADSLGYECKVAQRDAEIGTADIIRNIQAQMHSVGLLVKEVRAQGQGFVGEVFVYEPKPGHQFVGDVSVYIRRSRKTSRNLEQLYRDSEGEHHAPPPAPANLTGADIPW